MKPDFLILHIPIIQARYMFGGGSNNHNNTT